MGDATALIALPGAFSQDDLFDRAAFVRQAETFGVPLMKEPMLDVLETSRHLLPLLVAVSTGEESYRRPVPEPDQGTTVAQHALQGELQDPLGGTGDEVIGRWYSSWQLLELFEVRAWVEELRRSATLGDNFRTIYEPLPQADHVALQRRRDRTIALAALSLKYMPDAVQTLTVLRPRTSQEMLELVRSYDPAEALTACGLDGSVLRGFGEQMLYSAERIDPLKEWVELVRHMNPSSQDKLRHDARAALSFRRGAEVLLRAHEDITGERMRPNPDSMMWAVLSTRVTSNPDDQRPLATTLAGFGLSPQPRVLMAVEGQTEFVVVQELLRLMGVAPELISVHHLEGADNTPYGVVRYAIAPRVGRTGRYGQEVAAPLTTLWILADPEGKWSPRKQTFANARRKLREEVELQGGTISDDALDFMMHLDIEPSGYYEINNFTDDELLNALTFVAQARNFEGAATPEWRERSARALLVAKKKSSEFGGAFLHPNGPQAPRISKRVLALALLPLLEADLDSDRRRPIIRSVLGAYEKALSVPRDAIVVLNGPATD